MFRRKSATQTKNLLEYLANAQQEQQLKSKRLIAQTAVVDEKNADLATAIHRLENLLSDALAQDSFIDLDSLKKTPRIPAFNRKRPVRRSYLPEPLSSIGSLLPWKKKAYYRDYVAAEEKYNEERHAYDQALDNHQKRVAREGVEIEEHNQAIERYKQDFDAGEATEIEDYFTLVLEKSAYPAGFPKQTKIVFAAESETLSVDFALPATDVIPSAKSYAYDKIRDETTRTAMPRKQRRLLYASVLAQISLRTIHEIFTADRATKIKSIAFDGYVDGTNPASGQPGRFCLVSLNITRGQFNSLDLRQVEPRACLNGLNARLSRKPDLLLAVPPMTQNDKQVAPVENGTDIFHFKQRISELESKIKTQSTQITELERKLAARRDENGELASTLRNKQAVIAELETKREAQIDRLAELASELQEKHDDVARLERANEAQRERLAELVPALRAEQERNAELSAENIKQAERIAEPESAIQAEKDTIAKLERQPPEGPDDTEPIETITDARADSDFAEAGLFSPIVGEAVDDGAGGARIPPREPAQRASRDLAKPNLFEVMSVFIEAQGKFVDYADAGLPTPLVNRLVREGRLERHRFHTYRLRATLAGNTWYRERSDQQASPRQETEGNLPDAALAVEAPVTLRSLLLGEADEEVDESSAADGPANQPKNDGELTVEIPVLTEPTERESLIKIIGRPQGDSARLLALMMESGWLSNRGDLQPAFPDEFVNVIVDEINERAFDSIGENLIYEEGGLLIGHEDYCQDLETIFALPVYQHLWHR